MTRLPLYTLSKLPSPISVGEGAMARLQSTVTGVVIVVVVSNGAWCRIGFDGSLIPVVSEEGIPINYLLFTCIDDGKVYPVRFRNDELGPRLEFDGNPIS